MCAAYRVVRRLTEPLGFPIAPLEQTTGAGLYHENEGAGDGTFQFATDP